VGLDCLGIGVVHAVLDEKRVEFVLDIDLFGTGEGKPILDNVQVHMVIQYFELNLPDVLAVLSASTEFGAAASQVIFGLYRINAPGLFHDLQPPLQGLLHAVMAGNHTVDVVLEMERVGER